MRFLGNLAGTLLAAFRIGLAKLDSGGLSGARELSLPDENGTLATREWVEENAGGGGGVNRENFCVLAEFAMLARSGKIIYPDVGMAFRFKPRLEEVKALLVERYIDSMPVIGTGTASGSSVAVPPGLSSVLLTTGSLASGNIEVGVYDTVGDLFVNPNPPESSVDARRIIEMHGAATFNIPVLSAVAQRFITQVTFGGSVDADSFNPSAPSFCRTITVTAIDSENSGRFRIRYLNASGSVVVVDTSVMPIASSGDVNSITVHMTRDPISGYATIKVIVNGDSYEEVEIGGDGSTLFDATAVLTYYSIEAQFRLRKLVGTTARTAGVQDIFQAFSYE